MNRILIVCLLLVTVAPSPNIEAKPRPNILFICTSHHLP